MYTFFRFLAIAYDYSQYADKYSMKKNNIKPTILFSIIIGFFCVIILSGCSSQSVMRSATGSDESTDSTRSETNEIATNTASIVPIVNITSSVRSAALNEEISITASAIDPAGGNLFIKWQTSDGTIINDNGTSILWKAPSYGTKAILRCTATDNKGKIGSATAEITVSGSNQLNIKLLADRSSLLINSENDSISDYVPLPGAKVQIVGDKESAFSDQNGKVTLNLSSDKRNTVIQTRITYQNWDLTYSTLVSNVEGISQNDEILFSPGYENITVAKAYGDSFSMKTGKIEIAPVEKVAGVIKPIYETTISAGQYTLTNENGNPTILVSVSSGSQTTISLNKNGYQPIESYVIPTENAYATLVQARLTPYTELSQRADPYISSFKPGNYSRNVALSSSIVIGFAQPMAQDSIFNDFEAIVSNKNSNTFITLNQSNIAEYFNVEWKDDLTLSLAPKAIFSPDTTYALEIKKWNAYAADGRQLKNYVGFYRQFTTVGNPTPHVISYSPQNNETNINRSGAFSLDFDAIMDTETLTDNLQIVVENRSDITTTTITGDNLADFASITWSNENKTVSFVPKTPLAAHAQYVFKIIKLGIKSTAGKTVTGINNTWIGFTTGGF